MPKLTYTKNSIGAIIKKAEEGFVLTKKEQEAYQFITITGKQMQNMVAGLSEAIRSYEEIGKSVAGVIKEAVNMQKIFAEQLQGLFKSLAVFNEINALIQIPFIDFNLRNTTNSFQTQLQPVRIFVQPNEPYEPPKSLPPPKRKYDLPLTAVQIEGKGFTLEGEYVKGMTRKSEVGQLFELMIRSDLKGKIPDELIDQIKSSNSDELAYRARSYVIRDLKVILAGNKLKLDMERYRALEKYHFKGLTKYIRKPRRTKKIVMKSKTN
jgi:hypothetical protein